MIYDIPAVIWPLLINNVKKKRKQLLFGVVKFVFILTYTLAGIFKKKLIIFTCLSLIVSFVPSSHSQTVSEISERSRFKHGLSCYSVLLRPESRGSIRLNTTSPSDQPLIDPNYLERKEDVEVLLEGLLIFYSFYKQNIKDQCLKSSSLWEVKGECWHQLCIFCMPLWCRG